MGHVQELHEWQAIFAQTAMCLAFGEVDSQGELYISLAALRGLYVHSELPSYWSHREPRPWGFYNGLAMIARMCDTPKTVTMVRPTSASVLAAPSLTRKVAEVNEQNNAHGAAHPLTFSLAVKRNVIDVPGASAADWEIRVAMRLVSLLSELGFFTVDATPTPSERSVSMVNVAVVP